MNNALSLPLIAAQGLWVRRRVEVLPAASGPTTGSTVGTGGPHLRLVVVGDSTAAGCGAQTHEEAFAGAFARALAESRSRPVTWTVHGHHGATIRRLRRRVVPLLNGGAEVTVLLIGVNDVLSRCHPQQWRDDLAAVLDTLAERTELLVVAGIPPFEVFPSLPRALREYLAQRGRGLDDIARALCATRPSTVWIASTDLDPAEVVGFFARDGFHPSPVGYQYWAQIINDQIAH